MNVSQARRRPRLDLVVSDPNVALNAAWQHVLRGGYVEAFDIVDALITKFPPLAVEILSHAWDFYQKMPQRSRYHLYQSRFFDFPIRPGDKVLDIGSGHNPFPLATHLADIALNDHHYGRAGAAFKHIDGKPVFEISVDNTGFPDKEFDFVYCSHVMEHVEDPAAACRELMRIGRRGYIETPRHGKDIFLNSGKISNHRWSVEDVHGTVVFTEYTPEDLEGLGCGILQDMHCAPQTKREKAFAALIYLRAPQVNTMILWEEDFPFEVRALPGAARSAVALPPRAAPSWTAPSRAEPPLGVEPLPRQPPPAPLKFLQIHTFYGTYLEWFYKQNPGLAQASYADQNKALIGDAFSGVHMIAPYLAPLGYDGHLVVANCGQMQFTWMRENGMAVVQRDDLLWHLVRCQIEALKPDVLYLSDPITFDGRFIESLSWRPRLILGWRAANIPPDINWKGFDVMLSSLTALREMAVRLGARAAEDFSPGIPEWIHDKVGAIQPTYDLAFAGQYTQWQHPRRDYLLSKIAEAAAAGDFTAALYLSGAVDATTPAMKPFQHPPVYGLAMHRALRSGRIAFDGRGNIGINDPARQTVVDLARQESANMRIFEATGSGVFLLTERFDNLSKYFEIGKEIETYADEKELIDKIRYYVAHPVERQEIAGRGLRRCLTDQSMSRKARDFDAIVRRHLAAAAGVPASAPACV